MKVTDEYSILVVDDDETTRLMLKAILRNEGYSIAGEAHNGKEALALCAKHQPSVVLLDINMPEMDGFEVLKAIHQESPTIKVIMVSAAASMDKVTEAIKEGAAGFVVKPFNAGKVLDSIRACIKGHGPNKADKG